MSLKEIRIKKKISIKKLGWQSNISEAYLSMLENGKRKPTIEVINNIAKALKCKPDVIFLAFNSTESKIQTQE